MNLRRYRFFWMAVLLNLIGLLVLYSALQYRGKVVYQYLFERQLMWMVVAWVVFWITASVDYHYWKGVALVLYGISIALLVLVLLAGEVRYGAKRWLNLGGFVFQPSELAKVSYLLAVSYVASLKERFSWRWFGVLLGMTAVPFALIAKEPDLGTALVLLPIFLSLLLVWGVRLRWLIVSGLVSSGLLPIAWHFLKDYQRKRILVFLDPSRDPLGAGYTVLQSKIAIGSGGLWGKGYLSGTQNRFNFLPERHTDFIFSVLAEEWGAVGATLVILLFAYLVASAFDLALRSRDRFGRFLSVSAGTYIFVHAFVNIAMTCGYLPVVGLPLPFVSYGGTSLVVCYFLVGLLQSIDREVRRY